jgi:hypothetical protein
MSQNFLEIDKQDAHSNDRFEFENQNSMLENDLLSQRSAPMANLAADSESETEKDSAFSGELSNK